MESWGIIRVKVPIVCGRRDVAHAHTYVVAPLGVGGRRTHWTGPREAVHDWRLIVTVGCVAKIT